MRAKINRLSTFSVHLKVKFHQSLSSDLIKPFLDEMDKWANMANLH